MTATNARRGDWKTLPMPASRATIAIDRRFSAEEMRRIRRGVIPEQMEDKWFAFFEDGKLCLHRSWTGYCIYVATFEADGDGARLTGAEVNRDPGQYLGMDPDGDRARILALIDVVLLRRPIPEDLDGDALLERWNSVGRAMLGEHPEEE
jgi:hypothetical protein